MASRATCKYPTATLFSRCILPNQNLRPNTQETEQASDLPPPELTAKGLSSAEAEKRLKQYGYNEVAEKKPNPAGQFAKKFWGLSAWMLEAIIILSYFLQRYADMYIILGLLIFNVVLGFIEEQRASGVVESLKEKLRVNARVLRDGNWKVLPARELVPGDVVRTRQGDFVPADVKDSPRQPGSGPVSVDRRIHDDREETQRHTVLGVHRETRRIHRHRHLNGYQNLLRTHNTAGSAG